MARSAPPADARIGKKIDFIAAAIGDVLKPHGFIRKARRMWRELGEGENRCFQVLDLQGDKWNEGNRGKFCINIGVGVPTLERLFAEMAKQPWRLEYVEQPDTAGGCIQARLQDALPGQRKDWWPNEMAHDRDVWFDIADDTDLDALATAVSRAASEYLLPWFERSSNLEGLFAGQGGGMPDYAHHGCRLIAGVLLERKPEVAALFAERGSRWFRGSAFQDVKTWLASHGVDVAATEYVPEPSSTGVRRRNAEIATERVVAEAAEAVAAENGTPIRERLPQVLDAYLEACRTRNGAADDSPIAKQLKQADGETRRLAVLTILHRLVAAPTALPSRMTGVWGNVTYVNDHHWGVLLVKLLKDLPCDEDFARGLLSALLALTGRHDRPGVVCIGFPFPFAAIVNYLYREACPWSGALKEQVNTLLEDVRRVALAEHEEDMRSIREAAMRPDADEITRMIAAEDDTATRERIADYPEQSFEKADREAIGLLRKWLKRGPDGREPLEIEQDDWGRQLTGAIPGFPGDQGALMNLIEFLAKNAPTRPTRSFNKQLAEFLPSLASGQDREAAARWLEALLCGYAHSGLTHEWATTGPRPGVGAFLGETSGTILAGLVRLAQLWDAERFTSAFTLVAEAGFTVVPGIRMRSQRVGSAAIEALGSNAAGRQVLAEMRQRAKKPVLRKVIDSVLEG